MRLSATTLCVLASALFSANVHAAQGSIQDILENGIPGFFEGTKSSSISARAELGSASHRFKTRSIQGRFLVSFPQGVAAAARKKLGELVSSDKSCSISHDWEDIGVAGSFSQPVLDQLKAEFPSVEVEQEQEYSLTTAYKGLVQNPASWGLDRIDQAALPLSTSFDTKGLDGSGVRVYVVDTGIYYTADEYDNRVTGGTAALNFNSQDKARGLHRDCNGHGTHVAGTVLSNTYGIAKNAMLTAIKVLSCQGSGATADIVNGLNTILTLHPKGKPGVVNMSLGGPGASTTMEAAIKRLVANNITVVVAAGNENQNACNVSPAREPTAITVGATDRTDTKASYSNFGTCVDIQAPGSDITSTFASTTNSVVATRNTISGTSMASPHVAGVAALILQQNPTLTPAQVLAELLRVTSNNVVKGNVNGTPNRLLQIPVYNTPPVLKPADTVGDPSTPLPPAMNVTAPKQPSGVFVYYNATVKADVLAWQADPVGTMQCLTVIPSGANADQQSACFSSNVCSKVTNTTTNTAVLFCSIAINPITGTNTFFAYSTNMDVPSPNGNPYTYVMTTTSVKLNGTETNTLIKSGAQDAGGVTGNILDPVDDGSSGGSGSDPNITPTPGDAGVDQNSSDAGSVAKMGLAAMATAMVSLWSLI